MSFNLEQSKYCFTSFHPVVKIYLQRSEAYFAKMFHGKSMFRMQLQDYIRIMLDFSNKRSKMFNLKTFKIVLWLQLIH